LGYIYTVIHTIAIASGILFIMARQPSAALWTFGMLCISFIALLLTNSFIRKTLNKETGWTKQELSSTAPLSPTPKPGTEIRISNIVILFYIIAVIAAFMNESKSFDGILALLSAGMGFLAAISFFVIISRLATGRTTGARIIAALIGTLGGIVIFIIGLFGALISSFKHVQGD
jgi:hypothetical protein